MRLRRMVLLCALAVLSVMTVRANEYTFRHPEMAHALFGNSVNSMFEDHDGYLWVGTDNGLYRYDGYQLTLQATKGYHEAGDMHVFDIQEDANHYLWVSLTGLSDYLVFDPDRRSVDASQYLKSLHIDTPNPYTIHVDDAGNLWRLTSDSVSFYSFEQNLDFHYDVPGTVTTNLQRLSVRSYAGQLFIIDGRDLLSFNPQRNAWQKEQIDFELPDLGNVSESLALTECYIDHRGCFWLFSLFSEYICYRNAGQMQWQILRLPQEQYVVQNCIRKICDDETKGIWIATNHRGVFLYHPETGEFEHFEHQTSDSSTPISNNINTMVSDRHHTLWLGYYKTGFSFCQPNLDLLHNRAPECTDISALLASKTGERWIGTDGRGLWREDVSGHLQQVDQISNITITDIQQDSDGRLWVGTYDRGLYCVDERGAVHHYDATSGRLPHDGVQRLAIDSKDRVWVCSAFGPFYCFNPKSQTYEIIRGEDNTDLPGQSVVYDYKNNRILLATYYGIWVHDLENNRGYRMLSVQRGRVKLPIYQFTNLMIDDFLPLVWMTHHEGIVVWDTQADSIYSLLTAEGTIGDVQAMRQGLQHNIWTSTVQGISMIRASRHIEGDWGFSVHNFFSSVSSSSTPLFTPYAAAVTNDGKVLFGGPQGYTEFDANQLINLKAEDLTPRIASLKVRDSLVYFKDRIELSYADRPITLSFYTGNPLDANDISYAYRIVGLQENWSDTRANTLTIHSLAAGTYELEVKAIGHDGEWSPVTSITLAVSPPWWDTWYMYIVYLLVAVLCAYAFFHTWALRQRRLALEEKRQLLHQQQNQLFETKMQFFTNVSHEIRTPLSLILTPLEVLLKEPLPDPVHRRLMMIWRNSRILYNEVSNLLDFNKIGSVNEQLNRCQPRDLVAFVQEYAEQYHEILRDQKLHYHYEVPQQPIIATFDEDKLRKILYNLFSNAMKYTPKGGEITLTLSDRLQGLPVSADANTEAEQYVEFRLSDEGPGISKADKKRIFERFYQVQGKNAKTGTGIGLHLVHSFVRLHGGRIWVEDNHPKGSVFCFTLPLLSNAASSEVPAKAPVAPVAAAAAAVETPDIPQLHPDAVDTGLADVRKSPAGEELPPPVPEEQKTTILVVDDNLDLCQFIADSLSPYHRVHCAHDGQEALLVLQQVDDVRLVVSDVMMPVMDGLELCRRIKTDIHYSHIPVILLTARSADENVVEGLQQGADEYISKPFSIDRLRLRIQKFIELSGNRQSEFVSRPDIAPREITITPLDEQFLQNIINLVNDHLQDADFSVENMASAVNMSRSQLYKKLMAVTGKSPLDFMRTMRMKRAQELLSKSQLQVGEIAYQVGYNTLKTFTENFKSEFGITPTEWLRKNQRE